MCLVGPRQTENESTIGITSATVATQSTLSKKLRNQKPKLVISPSLAKLAKASRPAASRTTLRARKATASQIRPLALWYGSASQIRANTAGIRTRPKKATSHHKD